jgi:hypothetical protein
MTELIERGFGDNRRSLPIIRVSLKAFNSLSSYLGGCAPIEAEFEAGATVADVLRRLRIPERLVHLVLVNGRDVSRGTVGEVNLARELEDGDAVSLSGPVPYSWGYGAPVV